MRYLLRGRTEQCFCWVASTFKSDNTQQDREETLSFGSKQIELLLKARIVGNEGVQVLNKSGSYFYRDDGSIYIKWTLFFNYDSNHDIDPGSIFIDTIGDNQKLVRGSFGSSAISGGYVEVVEETDTGFKLNVLKTIDTTKYVTYETEPTANFDTKNWKNEIRFKGTINNGNNGFNDFNMPSSAGFSGSSGGGGSGTVPSMILEKVWKAVEVPTTEIEVHMLRNNVYYRQILLNLGNNWREVIYNYPIYDSVNGSSYVYTFEEQNVPENFKSTISNDESTNTTTITNIENYPLHVQKKWVGPVGSEVTVELLVNDVPTGKTITLNSANNWSASFKETLNEEFLALDSNGTSIKYTIVEHSVTGYTSVITGNAAEGFTVTNTYICEKVVQVTVPSGTKVTVEGKEYTVTAGKAEVPLKDLAATGKFDVVAESGEVLGQIEKTAECEGMYTPTPPPACEEVVQVTVPSGTKVTVEGKEYTVTAGKAEVPLKDLAENTNYTVTNVAGEKLGEIAVAECAWAYTEVGKTDPEPPTSMITIPVQKVWVHGSNNNVTTGDTSTVDVANVVIEPQSVTVKLLGNGIELETLQLTAANGWKGTFAAVNELDVEGKKITFSVVEESVKGYTATYGGSKEGFTVTNTFTETTTPEPPAPQKINVPVTKVWERRTGTQAVVELYANGVATGKTLTLTEAMDWKGTFSGLDKHDQTGAVISYTIREQAMSRYVTTITGDMTNGFVVTNRYVSSSGGGGGGGGGTTTPPVVTPPVVTPPVITPPVVTPPDTDTESDVETDGGNHGDSTSTEEDSEDSGFGNSNNQNNSGTEEEGKDDSFGNTNNQNNTGNSVNTGKVRTPTYTYTTNKTTRTYSTTPNRLPQTNGAGTEGLALVGLFFVLLAASLYYVRRMNRIN